MAATEEVAAEGTVTPVEEKMEGIAGPVSHSKKHKKNKELRTTIQKVNAAMGKHGHRKARRHEDSVEMQAIITKLLSQEVYRLSKKKKALKEKKARRKRREPTDKQKAQWAQFGSRVAHAKAMYYKQTDRSQEAWNNCMKIASGKAVDTPEETYKKLVAGLDEATMDTAVLEE